MTKSKMTLTKIAKLAGVSITSVSRVINTPHLTSKHIKERVNQAMCTLGFTGAVLKPYVQGAVNKKMLVIDNQLISDSLINQGIESKAKQLGYKLLYLRFLYFSEHEIQQIIYYTIHHQVDGILVINDSPYLNLLQQSQHALPPIVLVNQFSLHFPCVYFDHLSNGYQATKYLTDLGHKRIAILLGEKDKDETNYLLQGYKQALARANLTLSQEYIAYRCFNYSTSYKKVKSLMQLSLPPTAIICCDHVGLNYADRDTLIHDEKFDKSLSAESAICGVIDLCRMMKIDIPHTLSLLQFVHHIGHKQYSPLNHICAMYKPLFDMGQQAVSLLRALLEPDFQLPQALLIDSEFVLRHSTNNIDPAAIK